MGTISLEPLAFRHATRLQTLASDRILAGWAGIPHPLPEWEAYRWVEDALRNAVSGTQASFAVITADGRLAGLCELTSIDRVTHSAVLGFYLHEAHRGHGYMTAACRMTIAFGRERFGLESFRARVFTENLASIAVLRRLGFQPDRPLPEPPVGSAEPAVLEYSLSALERAREPG